MLKSQGSCKIYSTCTDSIVIMDILKELKLVYYKTHYDHDMKMAHIVLHASPKNVIAVQLVQGIYFHGINIHTYCINIFRYTSYRNFK